MIADEFRPIIPGGTPETFRRMRDAAWMVTPETGKINVEVDKMSARLNCVIPGCPIKRAKGPHCSRHSKDPDAPVIVVTKVTAVIAGIEPSVAAAVAGTIEPVRTDADRDLPLFVCVACGKEFEWEALKGITEYPEECPYCMADPINGVAPELLIKTTVIKSRNPLLPPSVECEIVLNMTGQEDLYTWLTAHEVTPEHIIELLNEAYAGNLRSAA